MEARVGWMRSYSGWVFYPRVYADHNVNNAKNRDVLTANRRVLATVSVVAEEKDKDRRRAMYVIGGFINFCLTF